MASKAKMIINWSDLPSDLIASIAEHLTLDMADYLRFRIVCKAWRASTIDPKFRQHPPQLLWLLVDFKKNLEDTHYCLYFLSFSDGRKHKIKLPDGFKSLSFVCHGWLVLDVFLTLTLWNPITGELVQLPTMSGLEGIERMVNVESFVMIRQGGEMRKVETTDYLVNGFAISSRNVSSCTFVVCFHRSMMLARCRAVDSSWTVIDDNYAYYNDVVFAGGDFYAVTRGGDVVVFSSEFMMVGPLFSCREWRLVELEGKVMILCRARGKPVSEVEESSHVYDTEKVHMFGLELKDNALSLVKLNSLARMMLFVGECQSVVIPIENYALGMENCVYFGDEYFCRTLEKLLCCIKSVVFNLNDDSKGELPYDRADTSLLGTSSWHSSAWYIPRFY